MGTNNSGKLIRVRAIPCVVVTKGVRTLFENQYGAPYLGTTKPQASFNGKAIKTARDRSIISEHCAEVIVKHALGEDNSSPEERDDMEVIFMKNFVYVRTPAILAAICRRIGSGKASSLAISAFSQTPPPKRRGQAINPAF